MTREEAIEIFKNMLDAWDNYYTIAQSDKKREAVWLAISSLETDEAYQLEYERTTKNDLSELEKNSKKLEKDFGELDCISRADAIQAMQNKAKKLTNEDTINGLCGAVAILFDMPSVTPQEPRKGHWILTDVEGNRVWFCRCSKCNKDPLDYIDGSENWWLIKSKLPKYCPNCGSDNREVEE